MASKTASELARGDIITLDGRDWVVTSTPGRNVYNKAEIAFFTRENKVGGCGVNRSLPASRQVTLSDAPRARASL